MQHTGGHSQLRYRIFTSLQLAGCHNVTITHAGMAWNHLASAMRAAPLFNFGQALWPPCHRILKLSQCVARIPQVVSVGDDDGPPGAGVFRSRHGQARLSRNWGGIQRSVWTLGNSFPDLCRASPLNSRFQKVTVVPVILFLGLSAGFLFLFVVFVLRMCPQEGSRKNHGNSRYPQNVLFWSKNLQFFDRPASSGRRAVETLHVEHVWEIRN